MIRRATTIAGLAVAVLCAGCHDPDRYFVSPDTIDTILLLTPSATSIPADGVSRITITASLDTRTTSPNRQVRFKTNTGQLVSGSTTGLEVTVTADSSGHARVELQSTAAVVVARVEATAGTVTRSVDIPFVAAPADSVLTVGATPAVIPANGFSRAVITARILNMGSGGLDRTVHFATSTGTLSAFGVTPGSTIDVRADSAGVATAELQSTTATGTARVQVSVPGVTREVTVSFGAVDPGTIITLSPSSATAPADGITLTQIAATVAGGLPPDRRRVTFTTNLGSFAGDTTLLTIEATADIGNRAVVDLRSPATPGTAVIRAVVNGVSAETRVTFVAALPNRVHVAADKSRISGTGTDSTIVRATLLRDVGKVSPRTQVLFTATDVNGQAIGTFAATTLTDDEGRSTATFNPGLTAYRGLVTITATVAGTSIAGSTTVQIID